MALQIWTTLDELSFINCIMRGDTYRPGARPKPMTHRSKILYMRRYIEIGQHRRWVSNGMSVDPQAVLMAAMKILDDLEGKQWKPIKSTVFARPLVLSPDIDF